MTDKPNFAARLAMAASGTFFNVVFFIGVFLVFTGCLVILAGEDPRMQAFAGVAIGLYILAYVFMAFASALLEVITTLFSNQKSEDPSIAEIILAAIKRWRKERKDA